MTCGDHKFIQKQLEFSTTAGTITFDVIQTTYYTCTVYLQLLLLSLLTLFDQSANLPKLYFCF